jgi:G3E family GTPase
MHGPISVSLVTGFLGAGKTTLIRRLLPDPLLRGTIVIVNDLAPMGLDNLLLDNGDSETILLANGCICCTVNKDLGSTLLDLVRRRRSGDLPPFSHVIIETTGMADPVPIMRLLVANSALAEIFALERTVTLVSAHHGPSHLEQHHEARLQVAIADIVLISHADTVEDGGRDKLIAEISALNPVATVVADAGRCTAGQLLAHARFSCPPEKPTGPPPLTGNAGKLHDVAVVCLSATQPLDWERLVGWVEGLGETHGANLLRVKGTVTLIGNSTAVFVNGVQDSFYPPIVLPDWFDPIGRSNLVVIGRGINPATIQESFHQSVGS